MVGAGGERWVARACWEKRRPEVFSRHFVTQGGYEGAEPEVSLTAFVLIALLESREVCKDYVNVSGPALNPTMVWGWDTTGICHIGQCFKMRCPTLIAAT